MATFRTEVGSQRLVVHCASELGLQADWLLATLRRLDAHGRRLDDGTTVEVGWTTLTLKRAGDDLVVCEPDYTGDPATGLVEDLSRTLRVLAQEQDLLRKLKLKGDPIHYLDTVLVADGAFEQPRVYLERVAPAAAGVTGWTIGSVADTDRRGGFQRLPVARLVAERPALLQALALPVGSFVVFEGDAIASILDARGEELWDTARPWPSPIAPEFLGPSVAAKLARATSPRGEEVGDGIVPCRPFDRWDALILGVATLPGVMTLWNFMLTFFNSALWNARSTSAPAVLRAWSAFAFVATGFLPALILWTLAFAAIRLRRPRPRWSRLVLQPGMSAACAVGLTLALNLVGLAALLTFFADSVPSALPSRLMHDPSWRPYWGNLLTLAACQVGLGIAAAWTVLALAGLLWHEPGWIDTIGGILGICWLLALVLIGFHVLAHLLDMAGLKTGFWIWLW